MMRDCHFGSSSESFRRFIANLILDFTVPKGMRSASAISECGRSSINDIRIATDCSRESWEMASAIRALSVRLTICVRHDDAGASRSTHGINSKVARDRKYPGRRARGSGIELRSLPPYRKQGILRDLLGLLAAGTRFQH